jgi:hypothetical protein
MTDAADTPIIVKSEKVEGDRPHSAMHMVETYTAPLDGEADPYAGVDRQVARGVHELLSKKYPGYPWSVRVDSRQGIIAFQLSDLMGATLHWVIRMSEYDGERAMNLVIAGGGELLERMGLHRGRMIPADYIRALANKGRFEFGDAR